MKIFIGQPVTGEDLEKIRKESHKICSILSENGNPSYCTLIEPKEFESKNNKDKMKHAFENLDKFDTFLAIIRNERKSEGMLMEIGYCVAKRKKIIIAIKKDIKNTYLPEIADKVVVWEDFEDLIKK